MAIRACYSNRYYAPTHSASMRKLPLVADAVRKDGLAELVDPGMIDTTLLGTLHNPLYVDSFLEGREPLASSNGFEWSMAIRDGVTAMNAGQLAGAGLAFKHGIAANIAQGFHHARYERGNGFCTFNGLALVAQQYPDKKIFVLDCDEHGGDGTEEFIHHLPNLYQVSVHGSNFGCAGHERSIIRTLSRVTNDFSPYLKALEEARQYLFKWKPDLVLYQAGADPHIDDPLNTLGMTTEQLRTRDELVFSFCREQRIPVLFVLAGGYQEPIKEKLVPLHVSTFQAAYGIYCSA